MQQIGPQGCKYSFSFLRSKGTQLIAINRDLGLSARESLVLDNRFPTEKKNLRLKT
jgi:hypothetical protein